MNILVIGAGNMGLAYAKAITKSELLGSNKLMILETNPDKIEDLKSNRDFLVFEKIEDCIVKADILFIAVKPYHSDALMQTLNPHLNEGQIVISIMAGITIQSLQDGLGIKKVLRAMPNLPAQIGKGLTSFTTSNEVSRLELSLIKKILETTGKAVYLDSENDIDASTGISGSGPAYVFYFMQSMMEAAKKMGFTEHDSRVLVGQTFEGAIELFNQNSLSPAGWMKRVASKGGTTRAALDSMDDNNVEELIQEAAFAAFKRAIELGKELELQD